MKVLTSPSRFTSARFEPSNLLLELVYSLLQRAQGQLSDMLVAGGRLLGLRVQLLQLLEFRSCVL